jgi:hypothetical protein
MIYTLDNDLFVTTSILSVLFIFLFIIILGVIYLISTDIFCNFNFIKLACIILCVLPLLFILCKFNQVNIIFNKYGIIREKESHDLK